MNEPRFTKPLATLGTEHAAVALAALLTQIPLDDGLEVLHRLATSDEPAAALNRAGWLLCCWDHLAAGGSI